MWNLRMVADLPAAAAALRAVRRLCAPPALPFAVVLTTAFALGGIASCGGSGEDQNGPKAYFVSKVYPQIEPTCADCHARASAAAPIFLANNPDGSYNAIQATPGFIAPPTASPLVQKGLHSGPALTDVQQKVIEEWLKQEPEGGVGDTSKPTNLRAAFRLFGQCMDYEEWKQLGLDRITETESSSGACTSCHNTGMASVWLSPDSARPSTSSPSSRSCSAWSRGTSTRRGISSASWTPSA